MESNEIVYVLSNAAMPGILKIGRTTQKGVEDRMSQLYSTGVPLPFDCEYAAMVDDCQKVESALHTAFGPYRINPKREFFEIEAEQAIAVLKLLKLEDVTPEIAADLNKGVTSSEKASAEKVKKQRRPRMDFHEMGIPDGSTLNFEDNVSTVEVCSNRNVLHEGEVTNLTAVTRKLLNNDYDVRPGPRWSFNGELLTEVYQATYGDED
ncbi:GIY-YIG nuclease family protein [Parahalioglobus pacificus]|uniref:Bacteriophage T5 Orf172 DNA-binding domain-containing protein n=1 Tax=Parahalioglobus pacificus TaxID=930806 RepID=A0A918XDB6_9GAMM|nr:GIY-YIG nuclease family protein [Halioglobus pacificus]GHD25463.1 hypothetical protein GCM10007053_01270 [Halioglobus pacificus]